MPTVFGDRVFAKVKLNEVICVVLVTFLVAVTKYLREQLNRADIYLAHGFRTVYLMVDRAVDMLITYFLHVGLISPNFYNHPK
jgi:hypothetical protein